MHKQHFATVNRELYWRLAIYGFTLLSFGFANGLSAISLGEGIISSSQPHLLLNENTNQSNREQAHSVSQIVLNEQLSTPLKILMIGNSYTQGNSTAPATYSYLQGLFYTDPNFDAEIVNESFGGATLDQHAMPGSDAVSELIDSAGEYDFVILQDRSDRPARAMKFGGSQLWGLNNGGPILIDDYIKVHQPQAEVILFNTWARHPTLEPANDDDLATYFNNNPEEMQSYTNLGYQHIITGSSQGDLSDITSIAPVGNAWQEWYTAYGYSDPNALLHKSDGTHQNDNGAYLAAAVLYEKITGATVIGNTYLGDVAGTLNGESIIHLLQQQAAQLGSVPLPGDYNSDGSVDAADYTVWRDNLGASAGTLANDLDGGVIGSAQYDTWQSNYGATSSVSTTLSVPEPYGFILVLIGLLHLASNLRVAPT